MERSEILSAMGELKLYGMKAAYDEVIATAVKRQHEPARIVGDLLTAEISEKQARSIRYQITIAKLPLAKDVDDFKFAGTPVNETLVGDLAGGNFLAHQRNVVLVGGTGTGKTHLAIAMARALIARAAGHPVIRTRRPADHRSRARRWRDAVAELITLQAEYEAWLEALPDTLQDTATAEALRTICDLDLADLQAIDPPRGFGRD